MSNPHEDMEKRLIEIPLHQWHCVFCAQYLFPFKRIPSTTVFQMGRKCFRCGKTPSLDSSILPNKDS